MAQHLITIYHPKIGYGQIPNTALPTYEEIGWTAELPDSEPTETSDADASAEPTEAAPERAARKHKE